MTLPDAHETARNAADRFGKVFRVYRLPAWPPAVYGATAIELPREAVILGTYPSGPDVAVSACQSSETAKNPKEIPRTLSDTQGSLF